MTDLARQKSSSSILTAAWGLLNSQKAAPFVLIAGALLLAVVERDLLTLPFTFLCGALIAAFVYALTARPRFSAFMAFGLLSLSAIASLAKHKFLGVNAHVFDLRFYFSKADTLAYLADDLRWVVAAAALVLAGFVALAAMIYRRDRPAGLSRLAAGAPIAACVVLLPMALPKESDDLAYHLRAQHFVSSFFVSLSDLARLARPDPLAERLAGQRDATPFPVAERCRFGEKVPDIFLVLSESAVQPSLIPGWRFDPSLTEFFRSYDGEIHAARVETHGGGTWISHTSALTGLSMADFGWMRPYVTMLLKGRLRHSLPLALAACGYHTALISPASFNFVNEGPMLKSLGIEDYLDRRVLNAPSKHEPDSFYFGRALDYYAAHLKKDGRPLFMFVATMAAHMPYFERFAPDRLAKGEPFGNDPETDEFLRRETFAQEDYRAFIEALTARRGDRPVLVAEFGDHHPYITRRAFESVGENAIAKDDFSSPLFETFYAVTPLGFKPRVGLPKVEALDVAYLGVTLLETAGVPLDPTFREERALRDHCAGAFHTCPDRAAVDRFLTRMVKSGELIASDSANVAPKDRLAEPVTPNPANRLAQTPLPAGGERSSEARVRGMGVLRGMPTQSLDSGWRGSLGL